MNKAELIPLLAELDIKPSKHLGQNFLVDGNLLKFIVRTASISVNDTVMEIGPGLGVLTGALLESGARVTAIEYDRRLASYIRTRFTQKELTLIEQDACKVDFESLTKNLGSYKVISNLPYSISTPIVAILTELSNIPSEMLFLIQKETAERFISGPGTKSYGPISIKIQASYESRYVRSVPPDVFFPRPDVFSAIVQFTRKQAVPELETKKALSRILHTGFLQRRKKLINNISGLFNGKNLPEIFTSIGIDINARPENLSAEQYLELSKEMNR